MGNNIETQLTEQIDQEMKEINQKLDDFDEDMKQWQPHVLSKLTENKQQILSFNKLAREQLMDLNSTINDEMKVNLDYKSMCNSRIRDI